MSKLRDVVHILLMLVIASVLATVGAKTARLLDHVDSSLTDVTKKSVAVLGKSEALIDYAGQTAIVVRRTAKVEEQTVATVGLNLQASSENLRKLLASADATVIEANAQLKREGDDVHAVLLAMQKPIQSADELLRDPSLKQTLAHIQSAAEHGDKTAQDIQKALHDATHPTKAGQATSALTVLLRILSWYLK